MDKEDMKTNQSEVQEYYTVPLQELVVFPEMVLHFDLRDQLYADTVEKAAEEKRVLFLVRQKQEGELTASALCSMGTLAEIRQIVKLPNGNTRVFVLGKTRAMLDTLTGTSPYVIAKACEMPMGRVELNPFEQEALIRTIRETLKKLAGVNAKAPKEIFRQLEGCKNFDQLLQQCIFLLPFPANMRQSLLEAENQVMQFQRMVQILNGEAEVLRIRNEIEEKVRANIDQNQKEYILREQLKVIREELGDAGPLDDGDRFLEQVKTLEASDEVREGLRREIKRYMANGNQNGENMIIRNYIETLLALPWNHCSEDNTDLKRAKEILERDHYGLDKVKERILEFLAVKKIANDMDTPVICLVGPPGTGKTSIAKSIAEALNRKYVRVCLGGVRDEAEIRGHRRTYLASMPGRIVQGLKQAGTSNPLMLLDEIDKLGNDYKGDPSAAMLEVLDTAQNSRFVDHFVELPVDLSRVIFLATANSLDTIPKPLLDRMEIIELSSYTKVEKAHIAKDYLIPKQKKKHGLKGAELSFSAEGLNHVIDCYTREAGVRKLERCIGAICRKVVMERVDAEENGGQPQKVRITVKNAEKYLGKERLRPEKRCKVPQVGIARGLAWTSVGGETLEVEVGTMRGTGKLVLTGRMGDVMRESAKTGISYLRSIADTYAIPADYFTEYDLHIHIPEGAIPKDGPSAGITMATAVLSAITGIPVSSDLAMTGEITLRGRVLPIGGLKEKLMAAKSIGIDKVLIPKANEADAEEIPEEIKEGMEICPVSDMKQVLALALVPKKEQK